MILGGSGCSDFKFALSLFNYFSV